MQELISVTIAGIRGTKDPRTFKLGAKVNRINILVAPNGYGKTTIARAFSALVDKTSLDVAQSDLASTEVQPTVILRASKGAKFEATTEARSNQVRDNFNVDVITNLDRPVAKTNGPSAQFRRASASMGAHSVPLTVTFEKTEFPVEAAKIKELYGPELRFTKTKFSKTVQIRKPWEYCKEQLQELCQELCRINCKPPKGETWIINEESQEEIKSAPVYKRVVAVTTRSSSDEADRLHSVLLLAWANTHRKRDLSGFGKYQFCQFAQKRAKEVLKSFGQSHAPAKVVAKGKVKQLIVEMPPPGKVSNGQRDLVYFAAQLLRAEFSSGTKPHIVVIDEVFDYLDDGNLLAAQYLLTQYLRQCKELQSDVYILLLTHLDPKCMDSYVFSKKTRSLTYLDDREYATDTELHTLIQQRNSSDQSLKDAISKVLHYTPEDPWEDLREKLGVEAVQTQSQEHHKSRLLTNMESYCADDVLPWDPIAVCAALRFAVEKMAYTQLEAEVAEAFLSERTTQKKLDLIEDKGASVPDSHFMLGIIYNDALHSSDTKASQARIGMKLQNTTIRKIIRDEVLEPWKKIQ